MDFGQFFQDDSSLFFDSFFDSFEEYTNQLLPRFKKKKRKEKSYVFWPEFLSQLLILLFSGGKEYNFVDR